MQIRGSTSLNAISDIEPNDLEAGELLSRFKAGAQVVCLRNCPQVREICEFFIGADGIGSKFWQDHVFDLAENHVPDDFEFGDMLRFERDQLGHLARKFCFYPDPADGNFAIHPACYGEDSTGVAGRPEMLAKVWRLALQIQQCSVVEPIDPSEYAVKIELLKYPRSAKSLKKLIDFVTDSNSRWSRLGRRIDSAVSSAGGPFSLRYVKHLYGVLSVVPGIGRLVTRLNQRFCRSSFHSVPGDKMLVGPPHTDGGRYLSMLTGIRHAMTTEVFANGRWVEVPVEATSLSVVPTRLYEECTGVPATVHRYLINRAEAIEVSPNVTLLIAVIPRSRVTGSA